MIAQIADSLIGGADFHVYLASPGMDVVDLMIEQNRLFLNPMMGEEQANIYASGLRGIFVQAITDDDLDAKQEKINELATTLYNKLEPEAAKKVAPSDVFFAMNMNALHRNPWMTYFLGYRPSRYLTQIKCPILALNGSKDIQVVPENLSAIKFHAERAEVTTKEFPELNHLMQRCVTGQVKEYVLISETINPEVLDIIVSWMTNKEWATN